MRLLNQPTTSGANCNRVALPTAPFLILFTWAPARIGAGKISESKPILSQPSKSYVYRDNSTFFIELNPHELIIKTYIHSGQTAYIHWENPIQTYTVSITILSGTPLNTGFCLHTKPFLSIPSLTSIPYYLFSHPYDDHSPKTIKHTCAHVPIVKPHRKQVQLSSSAIRHQVVPN